MFLDRFLSLVSIVPSLSFVRQRTARVQPPIFARRRARVVQALQENAF